MPWLLLSAGMLLLVTILVLMQPLPRIDRMLQDNARAAMGRATSPDIVIVAIDDKTLATIGRWPWRRAFHAELLRRIAAQAPRCIGMDVLLSEPDAVRPGDDAILGHAIEDAGCVVLPMALQTRGLQAQQELLPVPELAGAATLIGHAHLSIDEDGIARSYYRAEGFAGRPWPHFSIALRDAAAAAAGKRDGLVGQPEPLQGLGPAGEPLRPWLRNGRELIVFSGPSPYRTVSYVDVLQGNVPPDLFRDRFVLIGASAVGMGDAYATSSPDTPGLMPGVEILANVLQGLLAEQQVLPANPWQDLLFNLLPLAVALLGLLWLRPLGVVALIGAMLALRLGIHMARPWIGVQFNPAAGFVGLLLLYPLWSLMRLQAAVRYLRWGTEQLSLDFDGLALGRQRAPAGDFLDRQMAATAAAATRMRDLHRFVRDGINHLPDPTLILDERGTVMIANAAAQRHWGLAAKDLLGHDTHLLLADLRWRSTGQPMMPAGALADVGITGLSPVLGEGEDARGRSLLLRCVPFFNAHNAHAGWMVALVDISQMRKAQGQRDEALRFISHDIREPSAAILTIIELARTQAEEFDLEALLPRIERHAQTGLELADGFVNLARAEVQPFRPESLDLVGLCHQVIDSAWALARQRRIHIVLVCELEEAWCVADRSLLTRALTNVLSNALKYSPPGSELPCTLANAGDTWRLSIQDHGPGIAPELQSQLFQPFHRLHRDSHPEVLGVGLGLLLVRTVIQRHGGTIEIDSAANAGCTVTLVLPTPPPAEQAALRLEEQE